MDPWKHHSTKPRIYTVISSWFLEHGERGGAQDSMNPAMYPQSHFKALVLLVIVCLKTPIVLRSQILVSQVYKIPKLTTEY